MPGRKTYDRWPRWCKRFVRRAGVKVHRQLSVSAARYSAQVRLVRVAGS